MATKRHRSDEKKPQPVFDRTPPQNVEAERAVLAAMMLSQDAAGTAIETLHTGMADMFYVPAHQHVYNAIVELYRENKAVDTVTVADQLSSMGVLEEIGGLSFLSDVASSIPTSANVEYHAEIVRDAAVLRRIISVCTHIVTDAYSTQGDVAELLDRTEEQIFAIAQERMKNPVVSISDMIAPTVKNIERIIETKSGITGIPTGFQQLDGFLSGMQPSDMIVLAARPSVGKTAFALNISSHAAIKLNKSVLTFSLEMSKEQLAMRLFCMEGKIDSGRLRTGFLAKDEFHKIQRAAELLDKKPLYIDDTPGLTPLDLRAKARRHKAQYGLDLIVVDYLQLMTTNSAIESRQLEIATISRMIKGVARELSVPVLALCQLNREAEKDDSGSPKLSNLRESGAIEQDADVVLMLSRPPLKDREEKPNTIYCDIAKQRNGPTGKVEMVFDRTIQRFGEMDRRYGEDDGPPGSNGYDAPPPDESAREFYNDDDDVPF